MLLRTHRQSLWKPVVCNICLSLHFKLYYDTFFILNHLSYINCYTQMLWYAIAYVCAWFRVKKKKKVWFEVLKSLERIPTFIDCLESRRADCVVWLQVQPHLIWQTHDKIRDAGTSKSTKTKNYLYISKIIFLSILLWWIMQENQGDISKLQFKIWKKCVQNSDSVYSFLYDCL